MSASSDSLMAAARTGDRAALARLLTLVESDSDLAIASRGRDPEPGAGCHVIGFTGSPGAGKSSLLDRLAGELARSGGEPACRAEAPCLGRRPAILSIDPTSPFTGGAVLGDRVRISEETLAAGVFVRSMASRGSVGGLARAVSSAVRVLAICGCSPVMVETVGAGQGEVAVAELADTVVVVLVPGMGDDIQMLKMGILEIADVYAVNKSDLGGSAAFVEHLREAVSGPGAHGRDRHEAPGCGGWQPAIVATSARTGEGVRELAAAIESHRRYLAEGGRGPALRRARAGRRILRAMMERLSAEAECQGACRTGLRKLSAAVAAGKMSEWQAAGELLKLTAADQGRSARRLKRV
ncbi:MAG TPA: methylmalonyl Co-A mutase-associated GTPase MeaB [Planctomycetota bacterium]|nr:methylmalonyl Co-A mutase-associated GTPase MeaB [Planctomycetota bacterium]